MYCTLIPQHKPQDDANAWSTVGEKKSTYNRPYYQRTNSTTDNAQRSMENRGRNLSNVDIRYTIEELLTLYHENGIAPDLVGREDVFICN